MIPELLHATFDIKLVGNKSRLLKAVKDLLLISRTREEVMTHHVRRYKGKCKNRWKKISFFIRIEVLEDSTVL